MSENSATRVLEEEQKRACEDAWIRASDPRPPLAATTAARDGGFTEAPETGYGPAAELSTAFHRIMDRYALFNTEVQPLWAGLAWHELLSARPGRSGRTTRVDDVSQLLDILVAPAGNATRVLDAVAGGDLTRRVDPHDRIRRLRGARLGGVARHYRADSLPSPVPRTAEVATAVGRLEARDGGVP
ncbi:hypothetical protein [Streptomyces sp. NPDC002769]|uniref:hypothetical protein n=1 Tax=Streptomyces sp. NPDC002769 TaxID=3154542 RepID=UPI00332B4873